MSASRAARRRAGLVGAMAVVIAAPVAVIGAVGLALADKADATHTAPLRGSHFGANLQVGYEAGNAGEKAVIDLVQKNIAPDYGLGITAVAFSDANQLNTATANGSVAANVFQDRHWLKQGDDASGLRLTALGPVFEWAYSIYSTKYASFDRLPHGASIGVLNDPANIAQSLWLLQRAGKITFKPGVKPWQATTADIAANPNEYNLIYLDHDAAAKAFADVDAVIARDVQLRAAPGVHRLIGPHAPREFAAQLVVGSDYTHDPQIQKLSQAFFDLMVQERLAISIDPALVDVITPVSRY